MIDEYDFEDGSDELTRTGYIACRACGTRIRANREACLRCGQPLEAAPETVKLSQLSSGRPLAITVSVAALLVVAGVLFWIYRPTIEDEPAKPYASARGPAARAPVDAHATELAVANVGSGNTDPSVPVARVATTTPGFEVEFLASKQAEDDDQRTDDLASARARYEAVLKSRPNDAVTLNNLGQVLDRLGDRAGAAASFARAVELSPETWLYHFNNAHTMGELQDWPRAVREYRAAVRLLPDDYATQFNLALALHKLGNDEAAVQEYQAAIRLAPEEASFHEALGASFERLGKLAEARKEFQQYLDAAPSARDASAVRAHVDALAAAAAP